jgi:hypothetical protein
MTDPYFAPHLARLAGRLIRSALHYKITWYVIAVLIALFAVGSIADAIWRAFQ